MLAGIDADKLAPVVICMVCPGCSAILLLKRMPSGSLLHLNKYFPSCQGSIKITVPWGLVAALLLLFFFLFCFLLFVLARVASRAEGPQVPSWCQ